MYLYVLGYKHSIKTKLLALSSLGKHQMTDEQVQGDSLEDCQGPGLGSEVASREESAAVLKAAAWWWP